MRSCRIVMRAGWTGPAPGLTSRGLLLVAWSCGAAEDIPVHGVWCFINADWPWIGGAFLTHVVLQHPKDVSGTPDERYRDQLCDGTGGHCMTEIELPRSSRRCGCSEKIRVASSCELASTMA